MDTLTLNYKTRKGKYMNLETTNKYKELILNNTPLIDVRAPIEFEKGAFPGAINLPIMDDSERHVIGIKYKEDGNKEAVKLGHALVSGINKEKKITAWTDYIKANPDAVIYCFRGGQRSQISQDWIQEALGRDILRIEGGFKALRNYILDFFDLETFPFKGIRLGGRTGSGKTILLQDIQNMIDLEGIANHRGSSFGNRVKPQPSQINFEHKLAYDLIQKQAKGYEYLIFEDEGRHVGKCFLPPNLTNYLSTTPLIVLEVTMKERVDNIFHEYITLSQENHIAEYGDQGISKWLDYILSSVDRTKKRLGAVLHNEIRESIITGNKLYLKSGDPTLHQQWIQSFLEKYYDPMYDYQLENNDLHIQFKGNFNEIKEYLKDYK